MHRREGGRGQKAKKSFKFVIGEILLANIILKWSMYIILMPH